MTAHRTARLLASRELGPATNHFTFEALDWDGNFAPGQFLSLTASLDGGEVTRAYSIASAPDPANRTFALCANLVDGGRFSPWLFGLKPGDTVRFTGPWGTFVPRRPLNDSIFVATGTGIAPFRSMLQSVLPERSGHAITVIFGVRHREGLLYHDELQRLAAEYPALDYRPALTRPPEDWSGRTGRVQSHTLEALGDRRDVDVYICGLCEMVDDLRAQLKAAGLDRKRIIYEKYD